MFHQCTLKSVYTGTENIKPFYIKNNNFLERNLNQLYLKKELPGYFLCYGRANSLKYI